MVVHMDARSKEILALKRENAELRARLEHLEGMMALGGARPEADAGAPAEIGAGISLGGGTVSPREVTSASSSSKSNSSRTASSTSPRPKTPPPVPPRPAR